MVSSHSHSLNDSLVPPYPPRRQLQPTLSLSHVPLSLPGMKAQRGPVTCKRQHRRTVVVLRINSGPLSSSPSSPSVFNFLLGTKSFLQTYDSYHGQVYPPGDLLFPEDICSCLNCGEDATDISRVEVKNIAKNPLMHMAGPII